MNQLLRRISTKKGQFLLGSFLLLSVLTFLIFMIWDIAAKPFLDVQRYAVALAKQEADVTEVDRVSIYNGDERYFSVIGSTSQGEEVAVLLPELSDMVYVYPMSKGISKDKAEDVARENGANTIEHTVLGYREGQPIWEVRSGTVYYTISFETGELMRKEGL